jgi:Pentapeptide repeats (9 copies)
MAEYEQQDLSGSTFRHVRLTGSAFDDIDLSEATFRTAWMADAKFRAVTFLRVRLTGVEFDDVEISGEIRKLIINGVDVGPFSQAEFDGVTRTVSKRDRPQPMVSGKAGPQSNNSGTPNCNVRVLFLSRSFTSLLMANGPNKLCSAE